MALPGRLVKALRARLHVGQRPDVVGEVKIGPHSYGFEPAVQTFLPSDRAIIGSYCSAAPGVHIMAGGNHTTRVATYPFRSRLLGEWFPEDNISKGPVIIGHDVWIGTGAFIMSGLQIGSGSIVAARAVVAKSFPPYSVIAGNPARLMRQRFDDATVAALLRIAWWDWPHAQLAAALSDFRKLDAAEFAAKYDPGQ